MQSHKHSFIEQCFNYASGFVLAWAIWKWGVSPMIDVGWIKTDDAALITIIFTITSFARSYAWRRVFNAKQKPANMEL